MRRDQVAQLAFELGPDPVGWVRNSAPGDKLSARWSYEPHGWQVRHCGHPTANWPYCAVSPQGRPVFSFNGLGFKDLKSAKLAVEGIVAGWVRVNEKTARASITAKGRRKDGSDE